MPYLIDANNLAGKLNILGEKDFDQKLASILSHYLNLRHKKIILVFDGFGTVRENYHERLKVYYAGENYSGRSADEAIIELVMRSKAPQDNIIVSDDLEIREEIGRIARLRGVKIKIAGAKHFAAELFRVVEGAEQDVDNEDELSDDKKKEITDELMNLWQQ
jgi:predicted RNA-binding protein with PIN domain